MGSGLPSTSGSASASHDEMNAISDSSEQYQQPLPDAYDNYIGTLYESSPDEDEKRSSMVSLQVKKSIATS